jgi:hypothetical protein
MSTLRLIKPWKLKTIRQRLENIPVQPAEPAVVISCNAPHTDDDSVNASYFEYNQRITLATHNTVTKQTNNAPHDDTYAAPLNIKSIR